MRALPYDSVARCPCAPGPEAGQRAGRDATEAAPLRPGARCFAFAAPVARWPAYTVFLFFRVFGARGDAKDLTD